MKRLLLLDDSPSIHKVIKLTFSEPPIIDIRVAKNTSDADIALNEYNPDVVIAYILFAKNDTIEYLKTIQLKCSNILLLAQSDQDISAFENAGFTSILRKPFVGSDLKAQIYRLLKIDQVQTYLPPPIPTPPIQTPPIQTLPPVPPKNSEIIPKIETNSNINESLFKTSSFAPPSLPPMPICEMQEAQTSNAFTNFPEITIDVMSMEKSLKNAETNHVTSVADLEIPQDAENSFTHLERELSISFEDSYNKNLQNNNNNKSMEIELNTSENESYDLLEIESVVVNNTKKLPQKPDNIPEQGVISANLHEEINSAIDDALFKILDRAVPARIDIKLEEQLPILFDKFTHQLKQEIGTNSINTLKTELQTSCRELLETEKQNYHLKVQQEFGAIKEQVLEEIVKMRQTLANNLLGDVRSQIHEVIHNWLEKNIVNIAKAEIKAEIAKLLAEEN